MKKQDSNFFIHETSSVKNTTLLEDAAIYKDCNVSGCILGRKSTIGDFSRVFNSTLEEHCSLQRNNLIYNTTIGRYSYTGKNFTAFNCEIGAFCSISFNVVIGGGEHPYHFVTDHAFLYSKEFELIPDDFDLKKIYDRFSTPCTIGNDVWIGANACILRGVSIGDGSVIGAGCVVTKNIPPYSIVAGVPGRIIKKRFDDDIIERLEKIKWWNLPSNVIKENFELFNTEPNKEILEKLERVV